MALPLVHTNERLFFVHFVFRSLSSLKPEVVSRYDVESHA